MAVTYQSILTTVKTTKEEEAIAACYDTVSPTSDCPHQHINKKKRINKQ